MGRGRGAGEWTGQMGWVRLSAAVFQNIPSASERASGTKDFPALLPEVGDESQGKAPSDPDSS